VACSEVLIGVVVSRFWAAAALRPRAKKTGVTDTL
jgi:hypothetical protein